ncbi:MAG: RsmB/NOP family class I SAM-dependent RNA methyltransferase [Rhodospirillales bacterium]
MTSGTGPAGFPARQAAHDMLGAVLRHRATLDEASERCALLSTLPARDRAFARLIVATTLRRLGQIDAVLARLMARELPPRAAAARDALRIGAAQLLFLASPPHAAVGTAVALVAGRLAVYRGVVNAVLRRVAAEGEALLRDTDPLDNLPAWLRESWTTAHGAPAARAIAAAIAADPPLDLSTRAGEEAAWAERLSATLLATGSLRRVGGGAPADLPGYAEGAWWVQDAAATLPARLLGDMRGRTVIDLCAAPGGKTAQLAAAGAQVVAVERSAPRMERLRENLARLRLTADTVLADAATWRPAAPAPGVLLDAPCSATGTARRNPDMPHLRRPEDVVRAVAAQARLLDAAAEMTAPGGTLVYCVCSLQPEEGPDQIAAFLGRRGDFARQPVAAAEIGGLADCIDAAGDLRTLPCHLAEAGGMDGFHAARLVRQG